MSKELVVDDYAFSSMEEANVARLEKDKIDRLNEKLVNADNEILYKVYNKSIEKNTFRTPVGMEFMKNTRNILKDDSSYCDKLPPIPVIVNENKARNDEKNDDIKKYKEDAKKNIALFRWSLFINLVLVVIVIVFFVITATSKNPNIINYENVLIDKYSSWDQELTERERAVKEKEAEFNITYDD
ncbi:MAG: hypothetical protein K5654_09325 [Lachnospiraceae bacterium]|nr:hypothetical protein [Lachnospiraceae bacterium]